MLFVLPDLVDGQQQQVLVSEATHLTLRLGQTLLQKYTRVIVP